MSMMRYSGFDLVCAVVVSMACPIHFVADARAEEPSFDCATSRTSDEVAICNSNVLSLLDRQMADLYVEVRDGLSVGAQKELRNEQRIWLGQRSACQGSEECIANAYGLRIPQLKARLAESGRSPTSPSLKQPPPHDDQRAATDRQQDRASPSGPVVGKLDEANAAYKNHDCAAALRLLKPVAEQGSAEAQHRLGDMYEWECGPQDYAEAGRWYGKAAEQGYDEAQFRLGIMYKYGRGVRQDYAEAVNWFRKAAEQGNEGAQNNLGYMYGHGEGVPRDATEALKWFRTSAEQGNATAQYNVGRSYYDKVPGEWSAAAKWFRKAAEQGNADAQYRLGSMYNDGEGVSRNETEAIEWYRKAAEQGLPEAQEALGLLFAAPYGERRDDAEASKWRRRAAEQGSAAGQSALGGMYEDGRGVPRDYWEAARWYREAAEQRDGNAMARLGVLYETGMGVPQSNIEAYKWYSMMAADHEVFREMRDRIAKLLTGDEIAEAEQLAREWLAAHPKQ